MRQHARTRIAAAGIAGLALAGLLAGCAGSPGTAAVVDGRTIRTSEVTAVVDELSPAYRGVTPQAYLGALIIEPTLVQAAADAGLAVSDDDGIARLRSDFASAGAQAPDTFSAPTIAIGRYQAVAAKLSDTGDADKVTQIRDQLASRIDALDVTVNPRFGTFDPTSGGISLPSAPAWMATGS